MIFKYACVNEVEYEWDSDVTSKSSDVDSAISGIERFISRLKKRLNVVDLKFCFTSSPNFRYSVLPTYKHNRRDRDKPDMLKELRKYVQSKYKVKVKPKLEADDVMGILATLSPNKYIIATIDKDLDQIAGTHYNWMHDKIYNVDPKDAERYFYKQILMGDSTDGYKGCPSIGDKRSDKILNNMKSNESYWDVVVDTYESKGLTEEDALVQARVARILQATEWDFNTDTLRLWTPPKKDILFKKENFQIFKERGNVILENTEIENAHTHIKKYDNALKLIEKALENIVPREVKDLYLLESFARIVHKELAEETRELIEVRKQKGAKDSYHNKTGKKGV